ncbi:MAG: hypothetical protein ACE5IC_00650 [Candidatus Brocadiales bacterium]
MNERITLVILVMALLVLINLGDLQDSPDAVVEKYLKAVRAGDYETAYTYISRTDNTIIEWLELIRYIRREAPAPIVSMIDLAHFLSRQQIVKTTINGGKAVVEVDSVVPDMGKTLDIARSEAAVGVMHEHGTLPMRERHGICELAVEDGRWRITCVRGISASQAAELATELAEKILGKEDAAKLAQKIEDFQKRRKRGT